MEKSINHKALSILAFGTVLFLGLIMNLRGQITPLIRKDYGIDYSQLGFALSFFSLGSVFATSISGILIEKLGLKKVLVVGMLILVGGLWGIGEINRYSLLIITIGLIGIGLGVLNIFANSLASQVFIENRGRMMNFFHFFFGIGGFIAPIYANLILGMGLMWESTYLFAIGFIILIVGGSLYLDFPEDKEDKSLDDEGNLFERLKDKRVIIFALVFFFLGGGELGVINWLGVYLHDVQIRSEAEIGFYLSLFFILYAIGRLLASIVVEKIGYIKMIIIASLTAIFSVLIGIVGFDSLAIFFSLSGIVISVLFPTIQAIMFEIFNDKLSAVIGITLTTNILGFMLLSDLGISFVNDLIGIKFGYGMTIIYFSLIIILIVYLNRNYLEDVRM